MKVEQALADSEAYYRGFVEDIPVLICRFLPCGKITFVNKAYCEYFAKTSAELVGSPFQLLIPEADREAVMAGISGLTVESPTQSHEHRVIAPDGEIRWQRWTNRAMFDTQGKTVAYQSIGEDITERIKAEEDTKIASQQLSLSIENMLDGYALHKAIFDDSGRMTDFRYLLFNPVAQHMVGISGEKIIGKTALELFPNIVERGLMDKYADVMATGQSVHIDDFYYEGDNLNKAFDISCFRLDEEHFVCIFRDITGRKTAEAEREKLMELLIEKNRELEEIIRVATHDLRTPMVNIEGFNRILTSSCEELCSLTQKQNLPVELATQFKEVVGRDIPEAARIINLGVSKIDSLLDGLLRVAKLGYSATKMVELDMNAKITDIVDTMKYQAGHAGAEVILDKPFPSCIGDKIQINQVFSNLLANALKYLDPSRPGLVRITGRTEENCSIYCVQDNGIGIAEDEISNIFGMFYRIDPDGDYGEGLGLAIVRRIVNRHHGEVWVESEQGKGSKFFVKLPGA
ncbi:MAG: PAS domain S-box protein [Planctomycetota bacterium]